MKKRVIVRKTVGQRIGILAIYLLMLFLSLLLCILYFPLYEYGLLSLIGTLPILYIWLYYQMWSISFSERQITIKRFLRKVKTYTYSQIKDGRSFLFRLEDENAKNALKIIQTHSSLRNDI